jgi:hypothetical protein
LRCRSPSGSRQRDQAPVVGPPLYKPGFFAVVERLYELRTREANVAVDALSSPPGMRALGSEAVELGDERRRAVKTVSGGHLAMVPQWHVACQQ